MSTTITTVRGSAPALPEPQGPGRRPGAVLALARFEARELLLQIPVLVFIVLYLGFTTARLVFQDGMSDYPVLNTVDRGTQTAPLLLAIALLVCTNAAALRSRKHGTVQQFDVMAMEPGAASSRTCSPRCRSRCSPRSWSRPSSPGKR